MRVKVKKTGERYWTTKNNVSIIQVDKAGRTRLFPSDKVDAKYPGWHPNYEVGFPF